MSWCAGKAAPRWVISLNRAMSMKWPWLTCALLLLVSATFAYADEVDDGIVAATKAFRSGDVSGALKALEALRAANPDDVRPNTQLAYVLLMSDGDLERVLDLLTEHLEVFAGDVWALEQIALVAERALDVGRPGLARNCAKTLKKAQPGEKEHRYLWARASYRMGESESVAQACRSLIDDYPSWELPYWLLARSHSDHGLYQKVVEVYRDLLKEQPGNVDARMSMARAQLHQRDYDAAEESYRSALETARRGSDLRANAEAGWALVKEERELSKRLRRQSEFLDLLLIGVLCAWGVVIVVLVAVTSRPSG